MLLFFYSFIVFRFSTVSVSMRVLKSFFDNERGIGIVSKAGIHQYQFACMSDLATYTVLPRQCKTYAQNRTKSDFPDDLNIDD